MLKAVAVAAQCSRFYWHGLSLLYSFRCQHLYSSNCTSIPLLEKYLVHSLGFSKEEAAATSSKVTSWNPRKNPDLVINYLKQLGFDKPLMKKLVSGAPTLLSCDVSKTLIPKFQCLIDLGLSGPELVKIIAKNISIVERGLDTHLIPTIDCLRKTLGSDENVVKALKRAHFLLCCCGHTTMESNLLLLRNYGFSDLMIQKLVLLNPMWMTQKSKWIMNLIHRVENDFRVPLDSPIFPYGFKALSSQNTSTLEKKIAIFKSFGWSHDDILKLFRNQPFCIAHSEVKIQRGLNLFMKELGFDPAYLISRPAILVYSLEKRVLPRMQVLKILDEKKLERRKGTLYGVLALTESKFIEYFVQPYKDRIPDLYEPLKKTVSS